MLTVIRARTPNFINLPRQCECAYPEGIDLRCFGMLPFKFLGTLVE